MSSNRLWDPREVTGWKDKCLHFLYHLGGHRHLALDATNPQEVDHAFYAREDVARQTKFRQSRDKNRLPTVHHKCIHQIDEWDRLGDCWGEADFERGHIRDTTEEMAP